MNKLEKFCIKWLNDNYNHMEPFIMKEYPDYIFHMKDGKCILQYNKKNGYVYVSYKEIWKFFESYFCMSNEQIKDITKIWVEEHYKVGVTTTCFQYDQSHSTVEEHYKVGITTSGRSMSLPFYKVDEQYKMEVKSTQEFGWRLQKEVDEQYKMGVTKTTTLDKTQQEYSVEKQYKMGVTSTSYFRELYTTSVDEQYTVGITSTMADYREITSQVEEQYKEIQTTNNQLEFYSEKDVEELYESHTNIN